jgi:hypothetical protein
MSERAKGISRRELLTNTGKAAAATAAAAAIGWIEIGNPAAAAAAGPLGEIGTAAGGKNAFEFLGQVDQDGDAITSYGYLTAVAGLDVSQLFAGDVHDETTARFTYYGTATLFARTTFNKLFIIDADGNIQYFFDPNGGASFSDPSSFKSGTKVAADRAKFHDVLSVASPDTGMPYLTAALRRTKTTPFVLDGVTYTLGQVGLLQRSTATGVSTRLDPKPVSVLTLGGDAVVTGQA